MMTKRSYSALKAKRNGERFEHLIDVTCAHYSLRGLAHIQKTPEPLKPIKAMNRSKGLYQAVFTKKAQPDYTGTLQNGQSIVFEAKHTESTNIAFDRINAAQERDLKLHDHLGARALVVVSFAMKKFYAVPWPSWVYLKENSGKKSVNQTDLVDYEISTDKGLLNLLGGIV
ncbi:recombination protein U [Alkalibacterium subtropicum]|uniref:Holliday junction resolvase RecU n=1 Tax=Alkalibacterium subtropicum TaxID=753702 RepID=A0A1I1ETE0_9LACT|nr:Holliday junction resolvase RecU [Alkalibacterium subtropicum]SFB90395.1 recombination protein U [Alkalibacterium subtropicum]